MIHVTIQGNACDATSRNSTAPYDRIHGNSGTTAIVKFFHGPTRVCWLNGILIGSAVFAQLTVVPFDHHQPMVL